ncbi:MAG: DoxX family protein [Xanthobacteraceae bacterium]|nr:DoxX family protein [Xanthobacteraceae bacterium]
MPKNPFTDVWQFLTAATPDHIELGAWRYPLGVLFAALLIASIIIAWRNWSRDPEQRTGRHLGTWLVRTLVGCMWFEGMLWKLPLPASPGLQYWTEQMASRAAFDVHRELVRDVLLPHLSLFGPMVFLAELTFAVSMMLGIGVRLVGVLAVLFVTNLWLGIYRPGEPAEWPWSYVFLMMLMFLFALYAAGRSLGLDALLRREVTSVREGRGVLGRLFHIAG